jgi:ubiquinone biosynthesis protein
MLSNQLVPSRLVFPSERPAVIIVEPKPPSRFRAVYVFFKLYHFLASLLFLHLTRTLSPERFGELVRRYLENMGSLWVKAGKILALRKDLMPAELAEELDKLSDRGPGFPFTMAKQVVEQELGAPLERYFDQFAPAPFASTTMAQIHEAHLRHEDAWVAVKIQRPYSSQIYAIDIRLIRRVTKLLESLSILRHMRWSDLCWELEQVMKSEIDSRFEAAALRRLSKTVPRNGVYYPEVFSEYSTERLLVMELIRGALVSDFIVLSQSDPKRLEQWLTANNIDSRHVAKRLFKSVFRQILEDNFFHADLHPGNVILLRDSRIAIIDCRNAGSLESEQAIKLRFLVQALSASEHAAAADYFFLLASRLPAVDVSEVKAGMLRLMRAWETEAHIRELPYSLKSITHLTSELNKLTASSGFSVQWSLSRMVGALANLDSSLRYLWPQINYLKQLGRYFDDAELRTAKADLRDLDSRVVKSLIAARDLPRRTADSMLFQQILGRRQAQVIQGSASRIGTFLSEMLRIGALVLAVAEAFFLIAFLSQHSGFPVRTIAGTQIFAVISALPYLSSWIWLLILAGTLLLQRRGARYSSRLAQPQIRTRDESTASSV